MTITLNVEKREGKPKEGQVPAVVYGPKQEPISLCIDRQTFEKTLEEAGESNVLSQEGLGDSGELLIYDVAFNPVKGGVQHVDFYAIERGKELTTNVPLEFIGEAPATKSEGVLTKALHEVEITCRPSALPRHIEVDVSTLATFDDVIRVKDLVMPEGVKIESDLEETVVLVTPVKEEVEEPDTVDMDSIEVEQKGKAEDSGDSEKAEDSE